MIKFFEWTKLKEEGSGGRVLAGGVQRKGTSNRVIGLGIVGGRPVMEGLLSSCTTQSGEFTWLGTAKSIGQRGSWGRVYRSDTTSVYTRIRYISAMFNMDFH